MLLKSRLRSFRRPFSLQDRARISASLPLRHGMEKERLFAYHVSQMRDWFFQLRSGGYNLLAFGLGSKKKLLTEFARSWLTDGPVIVMNGYFPGANVKNVSKHTTTQKTKGQQSNSQLASHLFLFHYRCPLSAGAECVDP